MYINGQEFEDIAALLEDKTLTAMVNDEYGVFTKWRKYNV